jgi:hypothetical protein
MALVYLIIAPLSLIEELSIVSISLLPLVPLENFDVSPHLDCFIPIIIDDIISDLNFRPQISYSMDEFIVMVFHDALWIGLPAGPLRLLDELIDPHLLSLIEPDDGEGQPNQDDTKYEVVEWR